MIRCPNCNSADSRVLTTHNDDDGRDRERLCNNCGARYLTEERVSHLLDRPRREPQLPPVSKSSKKKPAPKAEAKAAPTPAKVPAPAKAPTPARTLAPARFHPVTLANGGELFGQMPMPIQALLLEWWNTARRQRNPSAAWTERAWLGSVERVAALLFGNNDFLGAQALATAGAEHGWQSLQQEYLKGVAKQLPPGANARVGKEQMAVAAIEALIGRAGA